MSNITIKNTIIILSTILTTSLSYPVQSQEMTEKQETKKLVDFEELGEEIIAEPKAEYERLKEYSEEYIEDLKSPPDIETDTERVITNPKAEGERILKSLKNDYTERLHIDRAIDPGKIWQRTKDRAIDYLKDKAIAFIKDKLGVEDFLTELNEDLSSITGDITTFMGIKGSEPEKGKLGIPNVQEAKIVFSQSDELNTINDIFGSQTGSKYSNRERLYQQYLRELTEEYSNNSALSARGQSVIKAKIDSAMLSAEKSLIVAEDSNNQDISQNIMRNISNQLALEQQINGMVYTDMQDAKVDRSLDLQLSSETLIEMSKNNTRKERESTAINSATQNSLFLVTIPGLNRVEEE